MGVKGCACGNIKGQWFADTRCLANRLLFKDGNERLSEANSDVFIHCCWTSLGQPNLHP